MLTSITEPSELYSAANTDSYNRAKPVRHISLCVVIMSASHAVGCGFVPHPGHTKDHHKSGTNCLPAWHTGIRVGACQCNPTVELSMGTCTVKSPGINPKSRVLYSVPSMLKKYTNGLINQAKIYKSD